MFKDQLELSILVKTYWNFPTFGVVKNSGVECNLYEMISLKRVKSLSSLLRIIANEMI